MPREPLTTASRTALFGKAPAHGDFIRRGDAVLVQWLDQWLTAEVEQAASLLGDTFDDRMSAMPPWRFTLPQVIAGAMIGSEDRVGRVFPLVAVVDGGRSEADKVANLLATAVEECRDADGIADGLEAIAADAGSDADRDEQGACWTEGAGGFPLADLPRGAGFLRLIEADG